MSSSASDRDRYLIVLSMDGFRWDYPAIYHTPNLDRMARRGVKVNSLMPAYPSKTFPNHYSIATGLYPDHHGIVQNSFYDPELDRHFRMSDRSAVQDSVFWEGEAIWETAEMQGVRTASYFWVGSESNETYRPTDRKLFESGFPYLQQIDTVIHWLNRPEEERPRLVMFYFDEPDLVSHRYGPVSQETGEVVERLDSIVGVLGKRLKFQEKRLKIRINLVVLSDHGMGLIPEGNQVYLEDLVDLKRFRRISGGNPVQALEPEPDYLEEAYRLLSQAEHIKVWKREEMPAHYHYGTHRRIPSLVVEADSAWGLEIRRRKPINGREFEYSLGTHGYDPANTDMHGIFYAKGPAFKRRHAQPTFENVSIYGLLAHILGLKPAKNDGNFETVKGMLRGN
ncbi:MAG: ectonucleotide pyrophosphatase/phosphodiesterase [Bacteroidales bacterium]